jgi:hypothetical protein
VAQVVGPEFKPQYQKKGKKTYWGLRCDLVLRTLSYLSIMAHSCENNITFMTLKESIAKAQKI